MRKEEEKARHAMSVASREDSGKGTALQLQGGHSKRRPALSKSPSARARSGRLKRKKTPGFFPRGRKVASLVHQLATSRKTPVEGSLQGGKGAGTGDKRLRARHAK